MAARAMRTRGDQGYTRPHPQIPLPRLKLLAIIILSCLHAAACSPRPNDATPTEFAPQPSVPPTDTSLPFLAPSAVESPRWTEQPQGIGTPFSLQSAGKVRIEPSLDRIEFPTTLGAMTQGAYLLFQDDTHLKVGFASMAADDRGVLVTSSDPLFDLQLSEASGSRWLSGAVAAQSLELIDLQNQYSLRAQGICSKREFYRSPEGGSIAYMCPPDGSQAGTAVTLEIISLKDTAQVQTISIEVEAEVFNPTIEWIREDAIMAFLGTRAEPCLISTSTKGMLCLTFLAGKPVLAASAKWIVVRTSPGQLGSIEVYPMDCPGFPESCDPAVVFEGEEFGSTTFSPSPDNDRLGMMSGLGLDGEPILVGYFDTKDWIRHDLAELSGDYVFVDWCPDSMCLVVAANDPKNSLARAIYLDGTTLAYPGIKPFQVVDLP